MFYMITFPTAYIILIDLLVINYGIKVIPNPSRYRAIERGGGRI